MNSQRIGVLGGGQLGRMLVEAASRLNISVVILDIPPDSPAKQIAATTGHVSGDFKDPSKIKELATKCDIITIEIEHVNTDTLELLEKESHVKIHPSPRTIRLIQDKYAQKVHLAEHDISVADFVNIPDKAALILAGREFGYPLMLKSKTLAYDGRGNYAIHAEDDISNAFKALSKTPLYAERWVPFVKELAVMVVRRVNGEINSYPVVETIHKDNICHIVFAPAQIDGIVKEKARELAMAAIKTFEGAGVFGVEMFLMDNDQIYVNEVAPRPHNSGHYTIEACETSQYENHIRSILDMPLGSTRMKLPAAAMINILGVSDDLHETLKPCIESLMVDGATIHLYGKQEYRKGRKMGHITIVGDSMLQVHKRIQPILQVIEPECHRTLSAAPLVSIIMGSDSDLPVMKVAAKILKDFDVPFEISIVSAHRTPMRMVQYAKEAHKRDIKVIIAGAGGAAHLPGMVAALTPLPVIGVPVKGNTLDGIDSLYSIVQMPRGIPVATVAINNSTNAALLAIRLLAAFIPDLIKKMEVYMARMEEEVITKVSRLDEIGWENY